MENKKQKINKILPDTSVIIEGLLSDKISKDEITPIEVIIHEAVIAELEHQANKGKSIGYLGLDEIQQIKDLSEKKEFELTFKGLRPHAAEIRHASLGEIDALIRQLAYDEDATLLTSDKVQSEVALARGMKVIYYKKPEYAIKKLKLDRFFDETTMSVHLRENVQPVAKKGFPGKWDFVQLRKAILKQEEIQDISREIIEDAKLRRDAFIEIERAGSTIVQLGSYRIVITRPPFSDGWEITAVRPVRTLTLEEYKLSEKLMKRIAEQAEGILIAGSPGMGKSTIAQALAVFYADRNKIVKTVEAPRDLVLPDVVTQYSISHGTAQEIHDVLLLSRPDYTIFDEMRNTHDFELYADMRLAGVGMVGIVHGTSPVDAIQRFIGRVEMGVIPQIIDTVIFIKDGVINKVLSLQITVKVPSGMTEADLARPVVVINDFESNSLEYEIYTYGEQTVVVPVKEGGKQSSVHKLASDSIVSHFSKYSNNVEVKMLSDNKCIVYVPEEDIARIIGRQGAHISKIEEDLGLSIDVQPSTGNYKENATDFNDKKELRFEIIHRKNLVIDLGEDMQNVEVDVFIGDEFLMTAKTSIKGQLKIKRNNPISKKILRAMGDKKEIRVLR
tara:strand:- start:10088 stop:11935 length:1848 start_codon:yes stop_codon:yes gene_type:complete